jgi:hypothetical protein
MTAHKKDRIENAIRHIESSLDVDPWAAQIAVDAMRKKIPQKPNYKAEDRYMKNHFISISICPICHREIVAGDMHCIDCGQAIDWEEK